MNVLFIVIGACVILLIGYLTYGKFLANKVFRLDDSRKTPAVEMEDGVDYVPADAKYLAGQHFSAIAAAGPIVGPIVAGTLFGWVPAMIWILVGSIFIGGVHDMGALIASVRHKAKSITEVVRENVSQRAFILFMVFIWITLVYIIVAFTDITARSFVGVVTLEDGTKLPGGALATSSIIYIILPIIMGLLLKFGRMNLWLATAIFLPLVGVAVWVGPYIPLSLDTMLSMTPNDASKIWAALILVYCLVCAVLPMWMLLQPRGHLGGFFLYASLAAAAIGIIFGGFDVKYPAFVKNIDDMGAFFFPMFPILIITVACGACSGFHSLVGSGTTSKQLKKESDAKPIGYGMMLVEGLVAVISLACLMILLPSDPLAKKAPNFIYASGIGSFLGLIGITPALGISFGLMAFTTFVYDTLDICTRLGRYIIEELTGLKGFIGKTLGSVLTSVVPLIFVLTTVADAKGNPIPAWRVFWNTFGASNQLLAALALIGVTVWLLNSRKDSKVWLVSFFPAVWMFCMSNWALIIAIRDAWILNKPGIHVAVPWASLILIGLSVLVAAETFVSIWGKPGTPKLAVKPA
jgi:carbon starvation protein